jgi:glucose-6-phosphate 1-epimerase
MLRTIAALVVAGTFVSVDAFSAAPGIAARIGTPARASALAEHKLGLRRGARITMAAETAKKLDTIELKSGKASATVYPFGATVASYKSPHEVLFVRPDAKMDGSKPISGGIPHCFPQFGPGKIQQHGFARNLVWKVVSKSDKAITLELTDNAETMAMWPNKFQALYKVTLMDDKLNCEMTVKNTDTKSWDFQAALHTYFHVNNIDKCEVQGDFMGSPHLNRMAKPPATTPEDRKAIRFDKEVDSCYEGVTGKVVLMDEVKPEESVTIMNLMGWEDTVLWSPYGNEGMGYKNFACVESVKAQKPQKLAPGMSWMSSVDIIPGKPK